LRDSSSHAEARSAQERYEIPFSTWPPRWSTASTGYLLGRSSRACAKPGVVTGHQAPLLYVLGLLRGHHAIPASAAAPHPHNFTDRLIVPATRLLRHQSSPFLASTCTNRTFSSALASEPQVPLQAGARVDGPLHRPHPSRRDYDKIAGVSRTCDEIVFETSMAAFV